MTDIKGTVDELAGLWPALAAALPRDVAATDGTATPNAPGWTAAAVVNPDVLAAILALDRDIPAAVRDACADISEHWVYRPLDGCLRQVPRLAGRMHTLGHIGAESTLTWQATGWLRMVKRALGLRRPDMPLGKRCPDARTYPERHPVTAMLFLAGAEGYLNPDGDVPVKWVTSGLIYCASPECGAAWEKAAWEVLGHALLEQSATAALATSCTMTWDNRRRV